MFPLSNTRNPHPRLIEAHFLVSGLFMLLGFVLLLLNPDRLITHHFSPVLLSVTHIFVLGTVTILITGVLYQFLPVIFQVSLYSALMAKITLVLLILGTTLLAVSFWNFEVGYPLIAGGLLIWAGSILFAANVYFTIRKSSVRGIESDFVTTAIVWLFVTILFGLLLAIHFTIPLFSTSHLELLKLHAHAGFAGWILQLIIGVASRLLPMFLVSHQASKRPLHVAFYLLNFGLLAALVASLAEAGLFTLIFASAVVSSFILFLVFVWDVMKNRIRKALDTGMKQTLYAFGTAVVFVLPLLLILLIGSERSGSLPVAYGFMLIAGFVLSLIMGQTYKILPFVVWMRLHNTKADRSGTLFPRDLLPAHWPAAQASLFYTGVLLSLAGMLTLLQAWIVIGLALCLFSVGLFLFLVVRLIARS